MKPIDIFITTFLRQEFAMKCVDYLVERTKTPYRITIIDNGGNQWAQFDKRIYNYVPLYRSVGNAGIHWAWNTAVALAQGEYFITSDPDLLVPDLVGKDLEPYFSAGIAEYLPDWLALMIKFMDERPDYGAISLCPHVFIGAAGIDPNDPEDVLERNMCGAVMRIMRTEMVKEAGGWDLKIEEGRNHEERTICSRLQSKGYKCGIASRVRAYHMFGADLKDKDGEVIGNWGYPKEFTPTMQKHNPELAEYVLSFDKIDRYNNKTWLPL